MFIEIKYPETGKILKINKFWLRDHCRCSDCYNIETKQIKFNLFDIPATIEPIEMDYTNDKTSYNVKWSDGHKSSYKLDFLYHSQLEQLKSSSPQQRRLFNLRKPWNRQNALENVQQEMRVTLPELIRSEEIVKKLVKSLIKYGVVFIDEVPPTTEMTQFAMRRVFPIMKTFFGEMFTFSDKLLHADTAYSKIYLGSHTDNTYFSNAAGLHSLHCLEHLDGNGGENFFVDGIITALELKRRNPRAFEILSTVQVPAEYIEDGQHHKFTAPIINIDPITGDIKQIRLNVYDRSVFNTIPQTEMQEFYDSLREYLKIVQNDEYQWFFKLNPGTYVIFDNWLVFHGRNAYTGSRTMTGCYVERTDFLSKARILGIID